MKATATMTITAWIRRRSTKAIIQQTKFVIDASRARCVPKRGSPGLRTLFAARRRKKPPDFRRVAFEIFSI